MKTTLRLLAAASLILSPFSAVAQDNANPQQDNPGRQQPTIELNLNALDHLKQQQGNGEAMPAPAAPAAAVPQKKPILVWVEGPKGQPLPKSKHHHHRHHRKIHHHAKVEHHKKAEHKKAPEKVEKQVTRPAPKPAPKPVPAKPVTAMPKPVPAPKAAAPAPAMPKLVPPAPPAELTPPAPEAKPAMPVPPPPPAEKAAPALPAPPAPALPAAPAPAIPAPPAPAMPVITPPASPVAPPPPAIPAPPSPAAQNAPVEAPPVKAMDEALSKASQASLSIPFQSTEVALPLSAKPELDARIKELKANPNLRVRLTAYASSVGDQPSTSRRIALSRALSVRAYLIDNGVSTMRIMVQAEGDKNPGGNPDRVDVFVEPQP